MAWVPNHDQLQEIIKIDLEIQARCGDGTGAPPSSHSLLCKCDELELLRSEITNPGGPDRKPRG